MRLDNWAGVRDRPFDVRIFVCGYEERANFVATKVTGDCGITIVLDYNCSGIFNYNANIEFFKTHYCDAVFINIDEKLVDNINFEISKFVSDKKEYKNEVLFDVSSCSRSVMASILSYIGGRFDIISEITCVYALSAFSTPPTGELPSPISEPVIGDLSGWSDDLSKPPCAVIGLGFEPGRALGCIDYLEIPEVRLFMPVGVDPRFEEAVRKANAVLINQVGDANVLPYIVTDPSETYQRLESLVHGLLPAHRPVLIPLGPKILAALSILLAIKLHPLVCVWRTSSGSGADVGDRSASGEVAVFTTEICGAPSLHLSVEASI